MRVVWSAVLVASLAASAYARTGGEGDEKTPSSTPATTDEIDRIQRLELEIEKLKAERMAEHSKEASLPVEMAMDSQDKAKSGDVDFKASFTDGFHIKSTDGNFDLHVGGRWEEEYRYTFNRESAGARTSVNTFYVREAFISVDGTIFKNWGFKLNGDFTPQQTATVNGTNVAVPAGGGNVTTANTAVSTGAICEEAYVEWKEFKEFRLLFGSFKQPVSMETTDSPRFAELIQRSPMARFMPNFDLGIKAYGGIMDSTFTYELAVTNGRSHLANQGRDQADDNDGKEYAGRLTLAPFVTDKDSIFKYLRLGVYGTFAHEGQDNSLNPAFFGGGTATSPATNIATNELAVTYLQFPGGAGYHFVGDRYRVGGEFTWAVGPAMIRGEFMTRHDEVLKPGAGAAVYDNLLATVGYYGEATFVLTGEDRIPNARIVPKNPFSIADGGFGALELAGRLGAVRLDNGVLTDIGVGLGRNGGNNSNYARSWTFGANWWPVQNVKFCVDYVGEYYGSDGVLLATGHHGTHVNGMLAHFQVDF
jgi:phosphate-selective porin